MTRPDLTDTQVTSAKSYLKQPAFSGPLDLLLQLIEQAELDITTISLAEVTDRYVDQVKDLEARHLPDISDFLVIAARLLLLKSRALLPTTSVEESEAEDDLAAQLAEYQLYKQAAATLDKELSSSRFSLGRPATEFDVPRQTVLDGTDPQSLWQAFVDVLERIPQVRSLPERTVDDHLTIEECIDRVKRSLERKPQRFENLFGSLRSRVAVIVTFLAILELFKQRSLKVWPQDRQLMVALR